MEELDGTLTDRGTQFEGADGQRSRLQDRLGELERVLTDEAAETEAIRAQGSEFHTRLEAFERSHAAQTTEMETVRTQRAELDRRLEAFERNLETMDARLDARQSERAAIPAQPERAEASLTAMDDKPEPPDSEQAELLTPEAGDSGSLVTMDDTLASLQTLSKDVPSETGETFVVSHEPEPDADEVSAAERPVTSTPIEVPHDDHEADSQAAAASRFTLAPEAQSDNLQALPSIGALTARMLKSMNVRTFRQIASFTPEDIDFVATALNQTPERIKRDDWVGNAKKLHLEKYGEEI
jgi:predicted flap endonuclease-1-like 5' DNA nuclease